MKVLGYNIKAATGIEGGHFAFWNYFKSDSKILQQIAQSISESRADAIGLIEVDAGSFRSSNQVEYLAKKLGYNYTSACKYGWAANLPAFGSQHLAILTRYPILKSVEHKFSVGFKRLALEAVLQVGEEQVSVIVTHLSLNPFAREQQIAELFFIINRISHKIILLGDFNQENLELQGLINCCRAKTFPSWEPESQLDYIFADSRLKPITASALNWQFSDHLPVYAELEI